jgi:AraC-like DNA-binding protein
MKPTIAALSRPGCIAIRGGSMQISYHRHHALQVTVGINAPVVVETKSGLVKSSMIVVPPDVDHRLIADDCLVLLIEPESESARRILRQTRITDTPVSNTTWEVDDLIPRIGGDTLEWDAVDQLLARCGADHTVHDPVDPRLRRVIDWVDACDENGRWDEVSFRAAASVAALSESRFRHLLREQFGIHWRAYILWRRLISALRYAITYGSATDAAHHAGFSDLAHLVRTCTRMFGMTPGEIARRTLATQTLPTESDRDVARG